jgi:hypothetical protein
VSDDLSGVLRTVAACVHFRICRVSTSIRSMRPPVEYVFVPHRCRLRNGPTCDVSSKRVHSQYERTLADTAKAGRSNYVVTQVRRYLCSNSNCDRRTYIEQIDGLTTAYPRTTLLHEILEKVMLALARRIGSRLESARGVCVGLWCTIEPASLGRRSRSSPRSCIASSAASTPTTLRPEKG